MSIKSRVADWGIDIITFLTTVVFQYLLLRLISHAVNHKSYIHICTHTTATAPTIMNGIPFNQRSRQHGNETVDVRLPKMRDCSMRSADTLCTVSSSMSEYEMEELEVLRTATSLQVNDGITWNTKITFDTTRNSCEDDNEVDSVVSHVSSLSGNHITTEASTSTDTDDRERIPPHIIGINRAENDDDDDDMSFAPLDDDDDDSSFAPLEDDETSLDTQHKTTVEQEECPSDEEADDDDNNNFIHHPHDRKMKPNTTSPIEESQNEPTHSLADSSNDNTNYYNDKQFIQQKTLPGLNNSYKVVCVSFLEYNIATSVACKVLDESFRMLRPGGLLYVIDQGGCTVKKHPTMRQWLSRVRDPTVKHLVYEIETRAILHANGFGHRKLDDNNDATTIQNNCDNDDWEDEEIVRWIGIKQ